MEAKRVGPRPMRAAIQDALRAPSKPPIAPTAKTIPMIPGVRCRVLYTKIRKTAKKMFEPRFDVDVLPAIFQIVGLPKTNRIPSHISDLKPLRPDSETGFGAGSGRRIHHNDSTETRNEAASTATARAAPTN